MNRRFKDDNRARVSFAVIAVIILVVASVTGAYIYTISKKVSSNIDIPTDEFSSLKNSIELDLKGMAKSALIKPLPVFNETDQNGTSDRTLANLMGMYRSKVDETFFTAFIEKFNGTQTFGDITVTVTLEQPTLGASFATPTFEILKTYSENGPETEIIPVGFEFNATVDIFMKDVRTGTMTQFSIFAVNNISTLLPSAVYLFDRMDLSTIDSMLMTMVQAVVFARAYGTYGEEMGYRLENIPKPGENFSSPQWIEDNGSIQAFGSDVGPLPKDVLLSAKDVDIMKALTFLIVQVRYFGTFDTKYAEGLLKDVHSYSLSDEGRKMTQQDLANMIGKSMPNYVNIEALALELFHRMGRISVDVDLVAPMFKKLMDLGIMSMVCTDWVKWFEEHFTHPKYDVGSIYGKSGWLDPTWMATDILVGIGYEVGFEQFAAMVLGFVLEAYHIDKPDEIRAFVQDTIKHGMKDVILKFIPDKIKVPPGSKWGIEIKTKDLVSGLVDKGVDAALDKVKSCDLLGMSAAGYILVYLFINEFQRPTINTSLIDAKVAEVYNNWMVTLKNYIIDQNLSLRDMVVDLSNASYVYDTATISSDLGNPLLKQYSTNSTINDTIQSTVRSLRYSKDNLTIGQPYMSPDVPFFIYGLGNETSSWTSLNSQYSILLKNWDDFDAKNNALLSLRNAMNSSSADYPLVNNSLNALTNSSIDFKDALRCVQKELDFKWELNVLSGIQDKLNSSLTNGSKASALYESIGILSNPIQGHPLFDFPWTINNLSSDIAGVASTAQEFNFTTNGTKVKMSLKDILNDKRGILGIQRLVKQNILDIKYKFVTELKRFTTLNLVENNSAWASHKTYALANKRLLNEKYDESLSSLHLMKDVLFAKRSLYENLTPKQLWDRDGNLKMYAEISYVNLEIYMVNVLINKMEGLKEIYRPMEPYPGWAASFGGLGLGANDSLFPINNISFNYSKGTQQIHFQGLRVFNNTTSIAAEYLLFEYLNPFSDKWQDYYLTNIDLGWSTQVSMAVYFNDTTGQTNGKMTHVSSEFNMDVSESTIMVTPEPIVDIKYAPSTSIFKSLRSVLIDRNVFSKISNTANVNFTFAGSAAGQPRDNEFRVRVMAYVRSLSAGWLVKQSIGDYFSKGEVKPANLRYLTKVITVTDNGEGDQDPSEGNISVKVELDVEQLYTSMGSVKFSDQNPLLLVDVWRSSDFFAYLSSAMLGSSTGEKQLFSLTPYMEAQAQGYFYFDYTENPMIGVYDVGKGDKEVDIPSIMSTESLPSGEGLQYFLDHVSDPESLVRFPTNDPKYWGAYNLTCEFKAINYIPPDSAIVMNKGMPLLVDFDRGHLWLRNIYIGLLWLQKNMSETEELLLTSLTPRKTAEFAYNQIVPPSEYKFALIYNFMPIYLQYFQGYTTPPVLQDVLDKKDVVLTWERDKNPDYEHIPYRMIPINIDRSIVAMSLWISFIEDLRRENLSINLFVYDIVGFFMREMADFSSMLNDVYSLSGKSADLQLINVTSLIIKYLSGFQKAVSDTLKTYQKDIELGRIVFATPGAKAKMDYGGFVYLGFDILADFSNETNDNSNILVTKLLHALGLWYDFKAAEKLFMEINKYVGYYESGMNKIPDNLLKDVLKITKNYQTYMTLISKYYQTTNPSQGKSISKFKAAAFYSIQQKYNMTDEQLTQNNELAWRTGYGVIDVSYLRHRNKFTLEQLNDLKDKRSYPAYLVHSLSCVVDLSYEDIDGFFGSNKNYSIWTGDYCNFGKRTKAQWQEVRDALNMGISKSDLMAATAYNIPYNAMMWYKQKEAETKPLVDMVKVISRYPGHDTLLNGLKNNPDGLSVLEQAYLMRNDALVIMPLGKDGPDIVLPDKVAFGMTYHGNGKFKNQSKEFIESKLPGFMNMTDKRIWLYIDLRFCTNFDRNIMRNAVDEALKKIDKDDQVQKVTMSDTMEVHSFIRTDKGLKEVGP